MIYIAIFSNLRPFQTTFFGVTIEIDFVAAVHPLRPLRPRRLHHSLHAAHWSRCQEWSPGEASHCVFVFVMAVLR